MNVVGDDHGPQGGPDPGCASGNIQIGVSYFYVAGRIDDDTAVSIEECTSANSGGGYSVASHATLASQRYRQLHQHRPLAT